MVEQNRPSYRKPDATQRAAVPGCPGDGDAMGSIHVEGQHVGDEPGLLDRHRAAPALRRRVEVGVKRAAVQLHQVQDGRRQLLHHQLCRRRGEVKEVLLQELTGSLVLFVPLFSRSDSTDASWETGRR